MTTNAELPEDLRKYLDSVPPFTDADLKALEQAAREDLDNDKAWLAEVAEGIREEKELADYNEAEQAIITNVAEQS